MSGSTRRTRDFTLARQQAVSGEIAQDYTEMQESFALLELQKADDTLIARLEAMKNDNPFGLPTVSYEAFTGHMGGIKTQASSNIQEAERRTELIGRVFPMLAEYDDNHAVRMAEYLAQAQELLGYINRIRDMLVPTGNGYLLDADPVTFSGWCGDINAGLQSYQTRRDALAFANSLQKPDGTYDWDAIERMWQSGELSEAQLLGLSYLYTGMSGEDAQRFINLAYVHPEPLMCESDPPPRYYYEYTNLDGTVTRVYVDTRDPANVRVVSNNFWQFSQFYVGSTQQIIAMLSTGGSFDRLSAEQRQTVENMAARSSVLTQVVLYSAVWEPTWLNGEPRYLASNAPVQSLEFNKSGGFTLELSQKVWDVGTKSFVHEAITITGSPFAFENGNLSEWLLDVVLEGEEGEANQDAWDSLIGFLAAASKYAGGYLAGKIPLVEEIMFVVGIIDSIKGFDSTFGNVQDSLAHLVGAEGSPIAVCENRQQAAAYFKRLNVLGAVATATIVGENGQVAVTVYMYSTATAYINWRNFCAETGSGMSYEAFVQAMLNPEETTNGRVIMKWVENMNGTVNTSNMYASFTAYIRDKEFRDLYPEQTWPDSIDACSIEQLDILYAYDQVQRGQG